MSTPIGTPRVRLPTPIRAGEIFEVRTLIAHIMETGQRRDPQGAIIPRDIIRRFEAKFDGELVFAADLASAVSANPFISFPFKAERAGTFEFAWTNDAGETRRSTTELRLA